MLEALSELAAMIERELRGCWPLICRNISLRFSDSSF